MSDEIDDEIDKIGDDLLDRAIAMLRGHYETVHIVAVRDGAWAKSFGFGDKFLRIGAITCALSTLRKSVRFEEKRDDE